MNKETAKHNRKRTARAALFNFAITIIVIVLFVGIIWSYYSMLYDEMRTDIIKSGQISAITSAERIDKYLSLGTDSLKIASYTLDIMIRDHRPNSEILDYLVNQSPAIESLLEGETTGLYGYVGDEYLDSIGWVPDEDYVPTERPWYIGAKANIGRVAVVDP